MTLIGDDSRAWVDAQFAAALEVAASRGRPVRVVLDIGAHVGLFARAALDHGCRVVAVEPNRSVLAALAENAPLAEIRPVAVTGDGRDLVLRGMGPGGEAVGAYHGGQEVARAPSITLARLLDDVGAIDLVKMDIEGSEYDAILATQPRVWRRVWMLALELHYDVQDGLPLPATPDDLRAALGRAGFALAREVRPGHNELWARG